ncbi:4'-phosphopantetheinyl transferase family protein [Pseudomonas citri]|uniref:4'-phosphopantetheinyl transferase family protein n=1 Tax=Pseudomonas citri TaxID=2978349 RepID=UPI0021B50AF8|nr:4'-phosphopantetheinyl transferase superfamily protein [Pseudomonas citri]
MLSETERNHSQTLEGRHKIRFINARIALRVNAADALGCANGQLSVERDALGQLAVTAPGRLFVSLSYGEHIGVLALATTRVGIDYETGPAPVFWQSAMRRYLCDCERRWLEGLPRHTQPHGFIWLWTRREAFLKYLGTGIRGHRQCLCDWPADRRPVQRRFSLANGIGTLFSEHCLNGLQIHHHAFDATDDNVDYPLTWLEIPAIERRSGVRSE